MEIKPLLPEQDYFNIGEASRIAQIPHYTLRYWEERLRLLRPIRRESGHRRYTRQDMETILRIKDLVLVRKMTLAGARKAIHGERPARQAADKTAQTDVATKKLLQMIRADLKGILAEFSR